MGIRSELLVHWTGNSGENDIEKQKQANGKPLLYLERLVDDYKHGLYAFRKNEKVTRQMQIKNIVRLCFTEIRLNEVKAHAEEFGKLGIGFSREFIMSKGGRPVIYVPYDTSEESRLLEDSINNVYKKSKDIEEIHHSSKWILAHVKRMGDEQKPFKHFEEMEWRVVYDETKHFSKADHDKKGIHRLKFSETDVQKIIFPDKATQDMALNDEDMKRFFGKHLPIIETLEDCIKPK